MTNSASSRPVSPYAQAYLNNIPSTTYFMEFAKAFASRQYKYFAFIEGNDKPYYIIPCENILGKGNTYFVRCDGKKNVKELVHLLENTNEAYKTANFFGIIDKDYGLEDEFSFNGQSLKNNHLYITPYYSFENFYVNKNTFLQILESEFNITEFGNFSIDYKNAVKNFEDRLSEFIRLIIDVDKKYRAYQIGKKVLKENKPDYHSNDIDTNIKNTIEIGLNCVGFRVGKCIDDCFKTSKNNINDCISQKSLSKSEECYQNLSDIWDGCKIIRGKFLIIFLVNYLKKLKEDLNSNNPVCFVNRNTLKNNAQLPKSKFYKCRLDINYETVCSVLAQYAEMPQCLIDFLKNSKV